MTTMITLVMKECVRKWHLHAFNVNIYTFLITMGRII